MAADIRQFVQERFSLRVTLPLTLILFAGPASLNRPGPGVLLFGWAATFLALLCLRMADDLASLEADRAAHPERGLPAGRIRPVALKALVAAGSATLAVVHLNSQAFSLVAGAIIFYLLFYKFLRERLPLTLKPFFSNAVFAVLPCYAGLVSGGLLPAQLFLAAFVWLAAVAHEWAHNVHGPGEAGLGLAEYAVALGPRASAAAALALFAGAGACGWLAWLKTGRPWAFGVLLGITTVHVGFLGLRLVRRPEYRNARPFYVAGFTFFLLPLAGLMADALLR
ncbi:MAG: UbiA family prenyltransferase [Deltaproteobacteria bacterium]|nr:UbiA family prenyltransferase [Deltaproteobacteria bacterium]